MDKEPPVRTVKDVFDQAHEINSPAERRAFLDQACDGAPEIRLKVEALLQAHEEAASSFLERPAIILGTGAYLPAGDEPSHPVPETGPYYPAGDTSSQGALPRTSEFQPGPNVPGYEGPGTQIGPYQLIEKLGEGGMGVVWFAEQERPIRRQVALKIIKSGMDSASVVARFNAERQALTMMDHVNIARVLDAGATDKGVPFFVMELVKGVPMTRFCNENKLTPRERLMLFTTVCHAIQHAHQKGIMHRDIKPSNVLVAIQDDGKPAAKVIDFGLAKATEQPLTDQSELTVFGSIVGTLPYMSPEQADFTNPSIDTRTDIYSLGAMLYELLTGTTPLDISKPPAGGLPEVLRKIKEEEPLRPSALLAGMGERLPKIAAQRNTEPARLVKLLRGELDWIVLKALEKDRDRRYETASGFAADVQRYLDDEPVEACPPSARYRLGKFARKHRTLLSMAAAFVVILALGVVGLTVGIVVANKAREGEANEKVKALKARDEAVQANNETSAALRLSDNMIQVVARNGLTLGSREKKILIDLLGKYSRSQPERGGTQEERFKAAETQLRLAVSFSFINEHDEAATRYRKAVELYEGLVEDFPTVTAYRKELARSDFNLGNTLHKLGKPNEAEKAYSRAIDLHERLAVDLPAEAEYRRDLADDYNNLGVLLRDQGQLAKAEKAFREAIVIGEKLVAEAPDHRLNLAGNYHNLGNAVRDQGDPAAALEWYGKAIQLLTVFDPPSDDVKLVLRNASWDRANALGQLGRHAEASRDWQRAVALEGEGPAQGHLRHFLAVSQMEEKLKADIKPTGANLYAAAGRCGLAAAAARTAEEPGLEKQYARRTLALLAQAKAAGWFRDPQRIAQLKADKIFDAIPAADFKAFLEGLEAGKNTNDRPEKE